MIIEEVWVDILLVTSPLRTPIIVQQVENIEQHDHNVEPQDEAIQHEPIIEEPQEIELMRSQRVKRSVFLNECVVYLWEWDFDIQID